MKITMKHPGTERLWERGHLEVDAETAALRDAWLNACDDFRVAFLKAQKASPEIQRVVEQLDYLEEDPNVVYHADKAGQLGVDHAEKVELRWRLLRRLQVLISGIPDLYQLQLARDDAHSAHDVNWDVRHLGRGPGNGYLGGETPPKGDT